MTLDLLVLVNINSPVRRLGFCPTVHSRHGTAPSQLPAPGTLSHASKFSTRITVHQSRIPQSTVSARNWPVRPIFFCCGVELLPKVSISEDTKT